MEQVHILSLGAGVQSSTLALMASAGEIEPMPTCAIFADTQDEPPSVYRWLDWLEGQLKFPVHRVTAGSLMASSLQMKVTADGRKFWRTSVPFHTLNADGTTGRITHRSCTRDFKIVPIVKEVRRIIGKEAIRKWHSRLRTFAAQMVLDFLVSGTPLSAQRCKDENSPLVIQWIGISSDEVQRAKPSRDPWIQHRWPLLERRMTRAMCLEWLRTHGYPEPPRSACVYCPFHSNPEWRRLQTDEPEAFANAVQFEKDLQNAKRTSDNFDSVPFLHARVFHWTRSTFGATSSAVRW